MRGLYDPACPAELFAVVNVAGSDGLAVAPGLHFVTLAPGESVHLTLTAAISEQVLPGALSVQYLALNLSNFDLQATAAATLLVTAAEPVVRCRRPTLN